MVCLKWPVEVMGITLDDIVVVGGGVRGVIGRCLWLCSRFAFEVRVRGGVVVVVEVNVRDRAFDVKVHVASRRLHVDGPCARSATASLQLRTSRRKSQRSACPSTTTSSHSFSPDRYLQTFLAKTTTDLFMSRDQETTHRISIVVDFG